MRIPGKYAKSLSPIGFKWQYVRRCLEQRSPGFGLRKASNSRENKKFLKEIPEIPKEKNLKIPKFPEIPEKF